MIAARWFVVPMPNQNSTRPCGPSYKIQNLKKHVKMLFILLKNKCRRKGLPAGLSESIWMLRDLRMMPCTDVLRDSFRGSALFLRPHFSDVPRTLPWIDTASNLFLMLFISFFSEMKHTHAQHFNSRMQMNKRNNNKADYFIIIIFLIYLFFFKL